MKTFTGFQGVCDYLPIEQQKEAYKWFLKGYTECANEMESLSITACSNNKCNDCCPKFFAKNFREYIARETKARISFMEAKSDKKQD